MKAAQMNDRSGRGLTEEDLDEGKTRRRVSSIVGFIVLDRKK